MVDSLRKNFYHLQFQTSFLCLVSLLQFENFLRCSSKTLDNDFLDNVENDFLLNKHFPIPLKNVFEIE